MDAYLVQANLAARRFARAETVAREALGRNPDQPRMVRLRAQALLKSGRIAEANKLLEDGVARQPESREFVVGLADLYADQKRTDDAIRMLEQARKTFGDDAALTMRMANVYEAGGRMADAEKELRRLMSEDPLNADAMNSLSYMLAENGLRLPEAVELAERAVKIEPGNPSYLDTLGWALFKQGRAKEAADPNGESRGDADREFGDPGSSRRRARETRPLRGGGRGVAARACRRRRSDRSRGDREEDQSGESQEITNNK